MPTEGATNISELDPNLPTNLGLTGEDYLQLQQLKAVLLASFPALDGLIVNANGTDDPGDKINPDAATWTELFDRVFNLEQAPSQRVLGEIVMWSGSVATVPGGFALCDGNSGTPINGVVIPDMRDRFVVGAGSGYNSGDEGGSAASPITTTTAGDHTHATSGHALTVAELPSGLDAALSLQMASSGQSDSHDDINSVARGAELPASAGSGAISVAGANGDAHSHGATGSDGGHSHQVATTLPPYYAVAYMIYVGV